MGEFNQEASRHFTVILVLFILLVIVGLYYQPKSMATKQNTMYGSPYYYPNGFYGGYYNNPYMGINSYRPMMGYYYSAEYPSYQRSYWW